MAVTAFQLPESAHAPCTSTIVGLAPLVSAATPVRPVRMVAACAGPVGLLANSSPDRARTPARMMSSGLVSRGSRIENMAFLSEAVAGINRLRGGLAGYLRKLRS